MQDPRRFAKFDVLLTDVVHINNTRSLLTYIHGRLLILILVYTFYSLSIMDPKGEHRGEREAGSLFLLNQGREDRGEMSFYGKHMQPHSLGDHQKSRHFNWTAERKREKEKKQRKKQRRQGARNCGDPSQRDRLHGRRCAQKRKEKK